MISPRQTMKGTAALAASAVASAPGKSANKPASNQQSPSASHGTRITQHSSSTNPPLRSLDSSLDRLIKFFASLRLTVFCLGLGLILVFAGTIAQVDMGLFKAQNEFFRSFFIYWGPPGASWKIPVFPGGYLVGGVLLINLVMAHFTRFKLTRKKIGIWMIHFGVILLLLGQLLTDVLSRESAMHLRENETKNYSETERQAELAVIDATDPNTDTVVAIPQARLKPRDEIRHPLQRPEFHRRARFASKSFTPIRKLKIARPIRSSHQQPRGVWVQMRSSRSCRRLPTLSTVMFLARSWKL